MTERVWERLGRLAEWADYHIRALMVAAAVIGAVCGAYIGWRLS